MRSCPSCGGIIGRDCFNPVECAEITASMNEQYAVDQYIEYHNNKQEKAYYENMEKAYQEMVEAEYHDLIITQASELNVMVNKFMRTV